MAEGKENICDSQTVRLGSVLTQPRTGTTLDDMRDCPRKTFSSLASSVLRGDRRHFWSTDLDLNEMKVADLQWERPGGDVESRLLLVRLLCLLAVGPHCWHISSVSDSTKLKMLGLSTDPISLWTGLRGFQRFRWRALSFSSSELLLLSCFTVQRCLLQQRITTESGKQNKRSIDNSL